MSAKLTYNQVIVEAITTLKERTGSSLAALKKAIASAHPDFNLQAVSFVTFPYHKFSSHISLSLSLVSLLCSYLLSITCVLP